MGEHGRISERRQEKNRKKEHSSNDTYLYIKYPIEAHHFLIVQLRKTAGTSYEYLEKCRRH